MRIVGACTTVAPSSSKRRASSLAWARARVTATVSPASGRAGSQAQALGQPGHRADDGDRGRLHPLAWSPCSAIVASVPVTVRWSGSVPRSTIATGCDGGRPAAISASAIRAKLAYAHVEHERSREARASGVPNPSSAGRSVLAAAVASLPRVARDECHRGGQAAVGDRDARVGGRGHARRDPGHDLEIDARLALAQAPPRRRARTRTGRRPSVAPPRAPPAPARSSAPGCAPGAPTPRRPACRRTAARRRRAPRRAPARGISRSYRIVSARAISSSARTVSSPGSPGPAPTRYTRPAGCSLGLRRLNGHLLGAPRAASRAPTACSAPPRARPSSSGS